MTITKRKICVVTGGRAEYGILFPLLKNLKNASQFSLQLIATGSHLSHEFGETVHEIEADGFFLDARIEMLISSNSAVGVAKAIGVGVIGFADAYARLQPDLVLFLGDRFEILAAAQAALVAKIPMAHLSGGDLTEGAYDDAIRHSLTKMANLHFPTTAVAARRVKQLGEDPARIFQVGSLNLDNLKDINYLPREELEGFLGWKFKKKNLLITFHAATLSETPADIEFDALLQALTKLGPDTGLIFTKSNADDSGRLINAMIDKFTKLNANAVSVVSLGRVRYFSTLRLVNMVVGNSSSGLTEVPSFHIPTINIGNRQKGRLVPESVISCSNSTADISAAIKQGFEIDCSKVINPYGDGLTAPRIIAALDNIKDWKSLIQKKFHDI